MQRSQPIFLFLPKAWAMTWETNSVALGHKNTQISLGISSVCSESLLSTWGKHRPIVTHWAHSKALIRLGGCYGSSESARHTHSVGFVMSSLNYGVDAHWKRLISNEHHDKWFFRTLVKRLYRKFKFLISQPKHVLWVLKRTVSKRRFF